jgi:hypothetical protein
VTADQLIGDREKLRAIEQMRRDALVALADYLTDRDDDYAIPWSAIRALCPADVSWQVIKRCFRSLLMAVAVRGADRSRPLPFDAEVDLDYMTGAR